MLYETITKISTITENEQGRYTWTVTGTTWHYADGEVEVTQTYATNPAGNGLFYWVDGQGWKQELGTCQFSLNCARSTRRARITRYFATQTVAAW